MGKKSKKQKIEGLKKHRELMRERKMQRKQRKNVELPSKLKKKGNK